MKPCRLSCLQIVTATATMYGCNSSIRWNPIAYIPVENSLNMMNRVEQVAAKLPPIKQFVQLDRPTFMAEDVAFFNGEQHNHLGQCIWA